MQLHPLSCLPYDALHSPSNPVYSTVGKEDITYTNHTTCVPADMGCYYILPFCSVTIQPRSIMVIGSYSLYVVHIHVCTCTCTHTHTHGCVFKPARNVERSFCLLFIFTSCMHKLLQRGRRHTHAPCSAT